MLRLSDQEELRCAHLLALNPTPKEERLLLRRRKRWHTWLRRTWHVFSVVVVAFALFFPLIVWIQINKKLDHQNKMDAIQASTQARGKSSFTIPANKFLQIFALNSSEESRLSDYYLDLQLRKADSLGLLSNERVGFRYEVSAVPYGVFGKRLCVSRLELITSECGCEDSTLFKTNLQIDSTGNQVNVVSSQKVALTDIHP